MATRTLTLRAGSARDIDLIDALMAQAFDPRFGEAWTRSQCMGVLAMPGVRLLIAFLDDAPAGFALTRAVADEVELLLLATLPAQRRRGVGATLLRALVADAQDAGLTRMHLEVRAGNEAVRLYTANCFARVGERRGYYRGRSGQLFDAHTYLRDLREEGGGSR